MVSIISFCFCSVSIWTFCALFATVFALLSAGENWPAFFNTLLIGVVSGNCVVLDTFNCDTCWFCVIWLLLFKLLVLCWTWTEVIGSCLTCTKFVSELDWFWLFCVNGGRIGRVVRDGDKFGSVCSFWKVWSWFVETIFKFWFEFALACSWVWSVDCNWTEFELLW